MPPLLPEIFSEPVYVGDMLGDAPIETGEPPEEAGRGSNEPPEKDLFSRVRDSVDRYLKRVVVPARYSGSWDESLHPRDEDGQFMKGYRIHPQQFTEDELHGNHRSQLWDESGYEDGSATRKGMSVSRSLRSLIDYFAGEHGGSVGRGAMLSGAHIVELEGDESGDDPWETENEALIHPKKLLSSTPIEGSKFMAQLTAEVNHRWRDQLDDGNEFYYDFAKSEWKERTSTGDLGDDVRPIMDEHEKKLDDIEAIIAFGPSTDDEDWDIIEEMLQKSPRLAEMLREADHEDWYPAGSDKFPNGRYPLTEAAISG